MNVVIRAAQTATETIMNSEALFPFLALIYVALLAAGVDGLYHLLNVLFG